MVKRRSKYIVKCPLCSYEHDGSMIAEPGIDKLLKRMIDENITTNTFSCAICKKTSLMVPKEHIISKMKTKW